MIRFLRHPASWRLVLAALVLFKFAAYGCAEEVEAVSSQVSSDYVRQREPDGSLKLETFAVAKGGYWSGAIADKTIQGDSSFPMITKVIGAALARKNYLPAKDPKKTDLLIVIYWGTTVPPLRARGSSGYTATQAANEELLRAKASGDAGAIEAADNALSGAFTMLHTQDAMRNRQDGKNARMLGYDSWWESASTLRGTVRDGDWNDLIDELEDERYFIVLMAYDFQLLWKKKTPKLVWETRFSIKERGNEFDQALPAMAGYASKYFGEDSRGLRHRAMPTAVINLGELKVLEAFP
jgi:hypothetical protein